MSQQGFIIKNHILKKYQGAGSDVAIPDGVTSIGSHAFYGCKSLTSITIPDGITSIGKGAFDDCKSLKNITIPDSVTSIGSRAFEDCTGLTSITIPDGVTSIGDWAFYGCKSLKNITIPDSVTSIGKGAFEDCTGLTTITIPDSVTSIGGYAFGSCTGLATITIPDGVTSIGDWAFNGCKSLKNITIPNSVTAIGDSAFDGCTGLTGITIPNSVTAIGDKAFKDCRNLTSITIPDSVTSIGSEAFNYCKSLASIVIPDSVTAIGRETFIHCEQLKDVTIPDSVTTIGCRAFYCCDSLVSVTLPDSVTAIGEEAFAWCNNLANVTIPKNVEEIGDSVLRGSKNLQRLEILSGAPLSLKTLDDIPLHALQDPVRLLPQMADGVVKQFLLEEALWEQLSQEQQLDLFLTRHGKTLEPAYTKIISQPDLLGTQLLGLLTEKAPAKLCNTAAAFMLLLYNRISPDVLKALYQALSSLKTAKAAMKKLEKESTLMVILEGNQEAMPPVVQRVWDLLAEQHLSVKTLQAKVKAFYSDIALPQLKDRDGNIVDPFVLQYLLTAHEALIAGTYGGEYLGADYKSPGVRPEAAEIVSMLSPSDFQDALELLAEDNLGLSGHSKKMYLAFPICRYASEDLMRKLTAKAPQWRSYVSGNDAPPLRTFRNACLYSETRSAMMLTDRFHDLQEYAALRGTDEDSLRDLYLSDVGLAPDGTKTYELGNQTVTAILQPDFSFRIQTEAGKSMKSIPKKGADPEKYASASADFSEMKKSAKKIVKNRCTLLFQNFLDGKSRKAVDWKKSYLSNPILRFVAQTVVWQQNSRTFTLSGTDPITADGLAYTIAKGPIAVAHPIEMSEQDITAWQKYFTSRGIKQPFAQVWEPVLAPESIQKDRYKGCMIPFYRFKGQEKHGITVEDEDFHSAIYIDLADCESEIDRIDEAAYELEMNDRFEVTEFSFKKYTRRVNHIAAYLDRITVWDRILKDDVTIETFLPNFTLAQITEFINAASENNCTNVTALLLNYKEEHFPDFDPMEEFTLGDF